MPETLVINGVTYVTLEQAVRMADEAKASVTPPSEWMSVAEAAKEARCDRRRIYAAIKSGDLEAVIPNGCVRGRKVKRASLYEWMQGYDAAGARSS